MKTIIKIPFDACIVDKERRGAAEAPQVIQNLVGEQKDTIWKEIDISGDFEMIQNTITKTALNENTIIGIGGDHSVSYGLMRAFAKRFKGGLIFFDAHLDCEDEFLPPTHEDLIRAVVNEGFFEPKNILIVGARKFYPKELEFIKEKGIKVGMPKDVRDFIRDKENIYISIDIDVFDPEFAPGTGYPEKDGVKPDEILPIIRELGQTNKIKGFDIVEVSPKKDTGEKTSKLAAKILTEFLKNC